MTSFVVMINIFFEMNHLPDALYFYNQASKSGLWASWN